MNHGGFASLSGAARERAPSQRSWAGAGAGWRFIFIGGEGEGPSRDPARGRAGLLSARYSSAGHPGAGEPSPKLLHHFENIVR